MGDVGPFGVVTLVLTLLLQVACLAALLSAGPGWLPVWTAVVVARLAMARTGMPGVPFAEGSSLGRAVAGTVSAPWLIGCLLALTGLLLVVTAGGPTAVSGTSWPTAPRRQPTRPIGGWTQGPSPERPDLVTGWRG